MSLERFHPAVRAWFDAAFPAPTDAQLRAWPSIATGRHTLLAAPTGSGKTLAAFLAAIDDLVTEAQHGPLPAQTRVLYVSPLKALSNDVQKNLQEPLQGIRKQLFALGFRDAEITTAVRSGDTPAGERMEMVKRPPHVLVTTPESLYLLLTSVKGRQLLATVRSVIVDEIHAVLGSKRGSHLALSLERLERLTARPPVRIGLSATQRPMEEVARFLLGGSEGPCDILDVGQARTRTTQEERSDMRGGAGSGSADPGGRREPPMIDLRLEVPDSPLEAVMSNEVWEEVYARLAVLIREHKTTLIFTNTRRLAERVARKLSELIGEEDVTSHHGSLSKERRLRAEQRLKNGELKALVATSSLELGIDIGAVDLVCQLGSPRAISALLQRAGRANHSVGGLPKARIFPQSRDDLLECAALLQCVRTGELDRIAVPKHPRDVLAQQIVAAAAAEEWSEDELFATFRRAYPYKDLPRAEFDALIVMLSEGFATRRGRRGAFLHRDAVHRKVRARKGARLTALTNGGAIPDTGDYQVVLEPSGLLVGTVNEDFAVESAAGDVFQLGNSSWRVVRVDQGKVRVEDAHGQPPTLPFWIGEAPGRSDELSAAFDRLRTAPDRQELLASGVPPEAIDQIFAYLDASRIALGVMPSQSTVVAERFFDEGGGMQLVVHSPFGNRVNRAWGLALRKRFCRTFNFELQAAATENAIVISLGPVHSFPLEDVFKFLHPNTLRDVLTQALLDSPMFEVRWRWNANRSLAVPRYYGGKKVPAPIQRMQAGDLLALVFPDQAACAENLSGKREVPDHPLVTETIDDCLNEAMDVEALTVIIRKILAGEIHTVGRDVTEPSPLAQEVLTARPYAFLDDAPLEERRTQAVYSRRWLDPAQASDLGALDGAAIARVRAEAWPDCGDPDELHDALLWIGGFAPGEIVHPPDFDRLVAAGRATTFHAGRKTFAVATERLPLWSALFPAGRADPAVRVPEEFLAKAWTPEAALLELARGRLDAAGPLRAADLADHFGAPESDVDIALLFLEKEGSILRGRFTPGATETQWCERRLLARIHRYTLSRLRAEIEPVAASDYLRFLFEWQRVVPASRPEGMAALPAVLAQLEGFAAPAAAWESEILPARLKKYDPAWLDALCLAGQAVWWRNPGAAGTGATPIRSTPILFAARKNLALWRTPAAAAPKLASGAKSVLDALRAGGPLFFDEIAETTRLLPSQAEHAIAELAAKGLVRSDSFAGLRRMIRRRENKRIKMRSGLDDAGRWVPMGDAAAPPADQAERVARALLARYGVVFRKVVERENLPPWRDVVMALRRLEARGEIRGGRFVAGFSGEQFALPEAVGLLRETRRTPGAGVEVSVSAADPLNLVGIVTPGPKIAALAKNRVLYRDGVPVAALESGETRALSPTAALEAGRSQLALLQPPAPLSARSSATSRRARTR